MSGKFQAFSGLNKTSHFLYAIVFGLFATLFFLYWQSLNQPAVLGMSGILVGDVSVQLSMPEHLVPGNENQQEFEWLIDYSKIPTYTKLTVNIASPDTNVGFSRDSFSFTDESSTEEINKAVVFYNSLSPQSKSFDVLATVQLGVAQGVILHTVRLDNPLKRTMVLFAWVLSGSLAMLNIFNLFNAKAVAKTGIE